jgi:transcription termination factor Rho
MEIFLSRELSERRIFPAIDLYKSGTRREDLLLTEEELDVVFSLRRVLSNSSSATDSLIDTMKKTKNNADFLVKAKAFISAQGK